MMLLYTVKPGIDNQIENYEKGCQGGRPKKLDDLDSETIAKMRQEGKTAKEIGDAFGVSESTVRRNVGWSKIVKTTIQNQNQEKEEEKENYKEKEKESSDCAADAAEVTEAAKRLGF